MLHSITSSGVEVIAGHAPVLDGYLCYRITLCAWLTWIKAKAREFANFATIQVQPGERHEKDEYDWSNSNRRCNAVGSSYFASSIPR
jgi:hypothetical protein